MYVNTQSTQLIYTVVPQLLTINLLSAAVNAPTQGLYDGINGVCGNLGKPDATLVTCKPVIFGDYSLLMNGSKAGIYYETANLKPKKMENSVNVAKVSQG